LAKSEYEKREFERPKLEKGKGEIVRVGMQAAFDKSEGNGGICDEEIGEEVGGQNGVDVCVRNEG
jgi:hypothetical protein